MNKLASQLATVLLEEMNETSDMSPVVTVNRRNLRKLLEIISSEGRNNDDE